MRVLHRAKDLTPVEIVSTYLGTTRAFFFFFCSFLERRMFLSFVSCLSYLFSCLTCRRSLGPERVHGGQVRGRDCHATLASPHGLLLFPLSFSLMSLCYFRSQTHATNPHLGAQVERRDQPGEHRRLLREERFRARGDSANSAGALPFLLPKASYRPLSAEL